MHKAKISKDKRINTNIKSKIRQAGEGTRGERTSHIQTLSCGLVLQRSWLPKYRPRNKNSNQPRAEWPDT